jgi:phenylalanyl-tRNA synthetase beta chain
MPVLATLSEFPSSRRDLSLMVPGGVSAQALCDAAQQAGGAQLKRVKVFDVYRSGEAAEGEKSLSLELHFQDTSRTLTIEEVDASITAIAQFLQQGLGAVVRA